MHGDSRQPFSLEYSLKNEIVISIFNFFQLTHLLRYKYKKII